MGLERDKAALAGLTLSHSNGLVEGKVNKLKLIKRMGYGRAGFPLLRQRVLHALCFSWSRGKPLALLFSWFLRFAHFLAVLCIEASCILF